MRFSNLKQFLISQQARGKALRGFLFALLAAAGPSVHADSCIWYADDDSIRQVQTSTNQVTRVVPLRNPHRLVMNGQDCGVWTLDKHDRKILRFDAEGRLERLIPVRALDAGLDEVERLHVDPYDGSLWVSDDRRIVHLSAEGNLLRSFRAPGEVRRMHVALDQTLWVLGRRELWHFDAQGTLLARHYLGQHLAGDARHFAIDGVGGAIWIVDDDDLVHLKLSAPGEQVVKLRLRHGVDGFALDPLTGNVWVAQRDLLRGFSRAGAPLYTVDLEALGIRRPEKLAFDPVGRALWLGAERSVTRFTDTGQFVVRLRARDGDEALGVPAFKVQPLLTLVRPPQDALTNNPQPEFRLGYGAECNGGPCAFPGSYFSGYQLSATLNDQPVGSAFQFDPDKRESFFTPSARLPEGQNSFSAQVKDSLGRSSSTISSTFAIDTVAPQFLTLTPADGAMLQAPQAILQGTVDDPAATVVLENLGLTQSGGSFSFPVTLQSGANIFRISAVDRAGNTATAQRTLNLIPLALSITAPAAGATLAGSTVLVTGTIQGPPNTGVTVNGVVAAISGNSFYASVPIQAGPNVLTVAAKTQDGFVMEQAVSVTGSGPLAADVSASPQSGLAPFKASFAFSLSPGSTVSSISADFDGNGSFDASSTNPATPLEFTYTQPGVFQAQFFIRDAQGNLTIRTVPVVVLSASAIDQQLRVVWGAFASALGARDKPQAMQYLSETAKAKYGIVYDKLVAELPQIVASLSTPTTVFVSDGIAEYAINRTIDGVNRIFFMYFVQGIDGVWRIESM
jgi:PKD repeat protein